MDNNINYKKSQTYELFKLINHTKDIIVPNIIGEYDYDKLISKEHEINNKYESTYMTLTNKDENGKWERFILKIRDYGYTTQTITYLYEIAKYFEIHDFSLSKISEKYIMDITLKLNEKIFSKSEETTLYMFAISQLFFQILITTLLRKNIYIKEIYYYNDVKNNSSKNIQDVIQSIINIEKKSDKNAEIILNKFVNGENIIISDVFWALDKLQNEKFHYIFHKDLFEDIPFYSVEIKHILSENALNFLKDYNNSLYNNEYIIKKNKNNNLKKKNIKEISIKNIIDNVFYRKNVVFTHFKYFELCNYNTNIEYQSKIILYLIKEIGIDEIKKLYLNNITLKNNLLEYIVNLLLEKYNNIVDINQYSKFDKLNLFIDEKTFNIYY